MSGDHVPIAPRVGPFADVAFLEAVSGVGVDDATLVLRHTADGLVGFERRGPLLALAGSEDLVDYRTPLGPDPAAIVADELAELDPGTPFRFDSLPAEARDVFCDGADRVGVAYAVAEHASTAVLELPPTFDDYLASLSKKERHEIRRKRRRYESVIGPVVTMHESEPGPLFDAFVTHHRKSPGEKGEFMTLDMEVYFRALHALPGWGIDAVVDDEGRLVAAGFGYLDVDGYFLYNSTYDVALSEASPGVVLLGVLIELTIERGGAVFDFLKGDELYKYRLGAHARPLFEVQGHR